MKIRNALACLVVSLLSLNACADITVGVVVSLTGPAASLGIPERNTVELLPTSIGEHKVRYIVLDDASDPTGTMRSVRKFVAEEKVDVIFGPSTTPTSHAVLEVAASSETPLFSFAGSGSIVLPAEGNRRWVFKLTPNEPVMGAVLFDGLKAGNARTIAFIGFSNPFGESFVKEMENIAAARGVKVTAYEKYSPTDTSVLPQVLRIMSTNPDAVIVAASGTPAATPVIELRKRGYKGLIFLNQAVANSDFLRVGGKDLDGSQFPVSPVLVAEQLPDGNPVKKAALEFVGKYEGKFGAGSRNLFGATVWDTFRVLEPAALRALKTAQPGTPAFRKALRDAIESGKEIVGAQGVFNLTDKDHSGSDHRAQVLVRIESGKWVLVRQ